MFISNFFSQNALKRKIGIQKEPEEILKYLNKTFAAIETQDVEIEVTEQDFNKAIDGYLNR